MILFARGGLDRMAKAQKEAKNGPGDIGYEARLWEIADALRGSMDAAEYKHVVLGLILPNYISDVFEEQLADSVQNPRAGGAGGGIIMHTQKSQRRTDL